MLNSSNEGIRELVKTKELIIKEIWSRIKIE